MTDHLFGNGKRGLLFILSAPAGTGKTTLVHRLTREFPCIVASVSCTTRPPRKGEIDGTHYYFLQEEEFLQRIANNDFLEHVKLFGHYYGTSKSLVEMQLSQGKHVVLVIDTQGALQVKGLLPGAMIFIMPPSLEELLLRLSKRNTESHFSIEQRLSQAKQEMNCAPLYDYCFINDDLDTAYQILRSIFIAEEHKIR